MRLRAPSPLWLLATWLCALPAPAAPLLQDLTLARDVICSFFKSGPSAVPPLRTRDDDLMMIIEGIRAGAGSANVTSSRALGPRPARVYAADRRVHIVEDVNESVIVTTVLDCETWNTRGATRKCVRFAAVMAWHFDRSVHRNPDRTFLALPGSSYTGHCEPWNIE